MILTFLLFALTGISQVCATTANTRVCMAPDAAGIHMFKNLAPGAYNFTVIKDGVESLPLALNVPALPTCPVGDCGAIQAQYDACSLNNFQMNDLIMRLKRTCGKKCAGVR